MLRYPERRSRQEFSAQLGADERQHQHRSHAGENRQKRSMVGPYERKQHRSHQSDDHIADQTVRGHRGYVGPQHTADHHSCHRNRSQDTDHGPLRQQRIEPYERQINRDAAHDLKCQQPDMQHLQSHLPGLHPTKSEKQHQKDQRRGNHPVRHTLGSRHRTAQQSPDHHTHRHSDRLDIPMQGVQQTHFRGILSAQEII